MTETNTLAKALRGLRSVKLTPAQRFRIQEQRSNFEALMKARERAGRAAS